MRYFLQLNDRNVRGTSSFHRVQAFVLSCITVGSCTKASVNPRQALLVRSGVSEGFTCMVYWGGS